MRTTIVSDTGVEVDVTERGGLRVATAEASFAEAVERGNVYLACSQATVTTQAGLSATTPALTIANRLTSGKVVKLWYAGAAGLVAAAAGAVYYLAMGGPSNTAVTETTPSTTVRNAKTGVLGLPPGIGVLDVATLPASPTAIALLGIRGGAAAITVQAWAAPQARWFNGAIWVSAGCSISIQTSTVDTIFCDFIFEVVDA